MQPNERYIYSTRYTKKSWYKFLRWVVKVVSILRDGSQCQKIFGSTQTSRKGQFAFAQTGALI